MTQLKNPSQLAIYALPAVRIKTSVQTLNQTLPKSIITRFTHILGVNESKAKSLFEAGARTIDDLIKNPILYDLNKIQKNGAKHFADLLAPIKDEEEAIWRSILIKPILKFNCTVLLNIIESRPSGIHSRIEVIVCTTGSCPKLMRTYLEHIIDFIPNKQDSVFESLVNPDLIARNRLIINSPENNLKAVILDVTIYNPALHPFPFMRELKEEIPEGYKLSDLGLFDKNNRQINGRMILGFDNPRNLEEILSLIDSDVESKSQPV